MGEPARQLVPLERRRPKYLRGPLKIERITPEEIRAYARVHFALMAALGEDAKAGERSMAAAILAYVGRFWGTEAFPALLTLAALAGLKLRAAQGHLGRLLDKGVVSIALERGSSHGYAVNFPEAPANPYWAALEKTAQGAEAAPDQNATTNAGTRIARQAQEPPDASPFEPLETAEPDAAATSVPDDPIREHPPEVRVLRPARSKRRNEVTVRRPPVVLPHALAARVEKRGWSLRAALSHEEAHQDFDVTCAAVTELLNRDDGKISNPGGLLTIKIRELLTGKAESAARQAPKPPEGQGARPDKPGEYIQLPVNDARQGAHEPPAGINDLIVEMKLKAGPKPAAAAAAPRPAREEPPKPTAEQLRARIESYKQALNADPHRRDREQLIVNWERTEQQLASLGEEDSS